MTLTWERATAGAHWMQLYETSDDLARSVTAFMSEALHRGDGTVVIATTEHGRAFAEALAAAGFDVPALTAAHRYTWRDAAELLPMLLVDDQPDPGRFDALVGRVVTQALDASTSGRVTAYGELVDLLWRQGRLDAALRLEALWDERIKQLPLSLMCGYGMPLLSPQLDGEALTQAAACHSHAGLAHDRGRLEQAVERALVIVLGAPMADALRPLILGTLHPSPLGNVERTILWLQRNLPARCGAVLEEARRSYREAV